MIARLVAMLTVYGGTLCESDTAAYRRLVCSDRRTNPPPTALEQASMPGETSAALAVDKYRLRQSTERMRFSAVSTPVPTTAFSRLQRGHTSGSECGAGSEILATILSLLICFK